MRKLLLLIALAILLASCTPSLPAEPLTEPEPELISPEPGPAPVFAEPTFMLDKLPELSSYRQQAEIAHRYYDEPWVDELRPAEDYGRLYSYVGKTKGYGWWAGNDIYGLADETGRIVVDPVYLYAYAYDGYLTLIYPPDTDNGEVRRVFEATEGFANRTRYQFASIDGSWVSDIYYGDSARLEEGRIIIEDWSGSGDYWAGQGRSFRIFDLEGNLLGEVQGRFDGFSEGRGVVNRGEYNEYIDLDGNVVIPGPFIEAMRFEKGRAQVAIGEDYDHRLVGEIDLDGNYLAEPSADTQMNYGSYQGDYHTFVQTDADGERMTGLVDKSGNTVVEAIYTWLDLPWEDNPTQAVGAINKGGDTQEYHLIELPGGNASLVDIGVPIFGAYLVGDWLNVNYAGGIALVKGDQIYRFDSPTEGYLNIRQVKGGLFAVNYDYYQVGRTNYRTDIFDTAQGKVIKSIAGWQFSNTLEGGLLVFEVPNVMNRYQVLEEDFTPAFGGENMFSSISYMEGGLYSVRTALFSGLMTADGEWLLRVFVNNLD